MKEVLNGQCLCGNVKYSLANKFNAFYLCHCKQCQQLTGSAFASNVFTSPDNIDWLEGEGHISKYEHSEREFSKSFCSNCGSALPFVNQSGKSLIVPAGSLDGPPSIDPQANIFHAESASWLSKGLDAKEFDDFPS
jgi:hypothetical protein